MYTISKVSSGIILFNNNWEILLSQRRYTYAFFTFLNIFLYKYHSRGIIKKLLSKMTVQELTDIYSLNFEIMWFRVWKWEKKRQMKRLKKCFKNKIGTGKILRKMIERTIPTAELLWEIPKGRKKKNETSLDCAIREFTEETCIQRENIRVFPFLHRTVRYYEDKIWYVLNIYPAIIDKNKFSKNNFKNIITSEETNGMKFFKKNELNHINMNNLTKLAINNIEKGLKNRLKNKINTNPEYSPVKQENKADYETCDRKTPFDSRYPYLQYWFPNVPKNQSGSRSSYDSNR